MKFTNRRDFPDILPDKATEYCWSCKSTNVEKTQDEKVTYKCGDCGKINPRVLILDPKMAYCFDHENRLVHDSCGVILIRDDGKLLLFQRTKFPYLLTIPAGHMEFGEDPEACAVRETEEEVCIIAKDCEPLYSGPIIGDSCLGGADIHNWHAFTAKVNGDVEAKLDSEGSSWGWYDINHINSDNSVFPLVWLIKNTDMKSR